jgi:hypothetical protein
MVKQSEAKSLENRWESFVHEMTLFLLNSFCEIYTTSGSIQFTDILQVSVDSPFQDPYLPHPWTYSTVLERYYALAQHKEAQAAVSLDQFAWVLQCSVYELEHYPSFPAADFGPGLWSNHLVKRFIDQSPEDINYLHRPVADHAQSCRDLHFKKWSGIASEVLWDRSGVSMFYSSYSDFLLLSVHQQSDAIAEWVRLFFEPFKSALMEETFDQIVTQFVIPNRRLVEALEITPDKLSELLFGCPVLSQGDEPAWFDYLLPVHGDVGFNSSPVNIIEQMSSRVAERFVTPFEFFDESGLRGVELFNSFRYKLYLPRWQRFLEAIDSAGYSFNIHLSYSEFLSLSRAEAIEQFRSWIWGYFQSHRKSLSAETIPPIVERFVVPQFELLDALRVTYSSFFYARFDEVLGNKYWIEHFDEMDPIYSEMGDVSDLHQLSRWYRFIDSLVDSFLSPFYFCGWDTDIYFFSYLNDAGISYQCCSCPQGAAKSLSYCPTISDRLSHIKESHEFVSIGTFAWVLQANWRTLKRRPNFPSSTHSDQKYKSLWSVAQVEAYIESNPSVVEEIQSEKRSLTARHNDSHRARWEAIAQSLASSRYPFPAVSDFLNLEYEAVASALRGGLFQVLNPFQDLIFGFSDVIDLLEEFALPNLSLLKSLSIHPRDLIDAAFEIDDRWEEEWKDDWGKWWDSQYPEFLDWDSCFSLVGLSENDESEELDDEDDELDSSAFERCKDCVSAHCNTGCVFKTGEIKPAFTFLKGVCGVVRTGRIHLLVAQCPQADLVEAVRYYINKHDPKFYLCNVVASADCGVSDILLLLLEALIANNLAPFLESTRTPIHDITGSEYRYLPKGNPERRLLVNRIFSCQSPGSYHYPTPSPSILLIRNDHFLTESAVRELQSLNERCNVPILFCCPAEADQNALESIDFDRVWHQDSRVA